MSEPHEANPGGDSAAPLSAEQFPDIRRQLLVWFAANARDLPWRRTREPYPIWVSEIMLQQTRVAAVLEHYVRFMGRFPSIVSLALAPEEEVLAVWSGLGYYRRAKLLHRAAQFIVREHQGSLPRTAEELHKLPGVGDYTAAAIASIAFGEPVAVVDGNVQRVIQRLFSFTPPPDARPGTAAPPHLMVREYADALLDTRRAGVFNQAMMELGAIVCLPKKPLCHVCPVERYCATRGEHPVEPRRPMRSRQIAYALVCRGAGDAEQVMLEQRPESASQMPSMWQLPEIDPEPEDLPKTELTLRHAITVTNYYVRIVRLSEREARRRASERNPRRHWIKVAELAGLPLTGLARKALRRLKIMPISPPS